MKGAHVRIEDGVCQEIEEMAKLRGITFSQLLRELIDIGLRVKKHMEGEGVDEKSETDPHLEHGASAAIEALLLLRKMASQMNSEWVIQAHEDAAKKIGEVAS